MEEIQKFRESKPCECGGLMLRYFDRKTWVTFWECDSCKKQIKEQI